MQYTCTICSVCAARCTQHPVCECPVSVTSLQIVRDGRCACIRSIAFIAGPFARSSSPRIGGLDVMVNGWLHSQ